ncbi:MAG: hypothetical protein ABIQ04_01645 [Candidatus Saccharimonadales bacterium]
MIKHITPRQTTYITAYSNPDSPSFGNSYRSALQAGYSDQTARNMTHLQPEWLSENIGKLSVIKPDEIMQRLTDIIHNENEPTIVRLKAVEMAMKAYSMLAHTREKPTETVLLNINLM